MHGIWPTATKKYYTSKGPVQSEVFTADLTTTTLNTELGDFINDAKDLGLKTLNFNNPFYINYRDNLLSLPRLVKQNGVFFLTAPLYTSNKIYGYNSMTRSVLVADFARNTSKAQVNLNDTTRIFNQDANLPDVGLGGGKKVSLRFGNTAQNLFTYSDDIGNAVYTKSSGVVLSDGNVTGAKSGTIPSGSTTNENIYNTSFNTIEGNVYTLSILIKEPDLIPGLLSNNTCHFQFVVNGVSVSPGGVKGETGWVSDYNIRKVSQYTDAGYIYSISFTARSTSNTIGIHKFAGNLNDKSITVCGMQLEEGYSSHDFIRTLSSSSICAADTLSLDVDCLSYDEWTIYMDFAIQTTGDGQPCYILSTDSTAAHSYLYIPDTSTMEVATRYGYNGSNMVIGPIPQSTRQRVVLTYSKNKGTGGYATLRREGLDSPVGHEWSTGTNTPKAIPYNNHLEFFTGPGFVSAELKAFVVFDKWMTLTDIDLEDI